MHLIPCDEKPPLLGQEAGLLQRCCKKVEASYFEVGFFSGEPLLAAAWVSLCCPKMRRSRGSVETDPFFRDFLAFFLIERLCKQK